MREDLDLGLTQFYWRTRSSLDELPNGIPARMPFAFSFISDLQLIIQKRNPQVLSILERVYKENSNVGYLQDGHGLAATYGGDFIDFILRCISSFSKPATTAIDIGCGGVYLLKRLKDYGLMVKGIDPSPITLEAGAKTGIDVIPLFYPDVNFKEQFDLIIHYDVLEHVERPDIFLKGHHLNLSENGAVIFAVPDCTEHIKIGDISMSLHEHLNYFDADSLERLLHVSGFRPLLLERSRNGSVLFCCAIPDLSVKSVSGNGNASKFEKFCHRANLAMDRFSAITADKAELGFYVPIRVLPYLSRLPKRQLIRFFDDDPGLHGRYYDGFDIPIENFTDFVMRPPKRIVICSLVFGQTIADRISATGISIDIINWRQLFNAD